MMSRDIHRTMPLLIIIKINCDVTVRQDFASTSYQILWPIHHFEVINISAF